MGAGSGPGGPGSAGGGGVGPGAPGGGPVPGAGGDRGERGDRGGDRGDRGGGDRGGGDGWRNNRMPRRRDRDRQGARSLHVRGYNVGTVGDRELRQVFEEFGQVVDVYLPRDYFTKDLRGFAYVQFASENEADAARRKLDHQDIFKDGREVHIMWAAGDRKTPNDMRRIDVLRDNPHARRARMGGGGGGPPDWHHGRSRSPGRKRPRSMSPRRGGYRDRHHSPYRGGVGGRGYPRRRSRSPRRRSSRSPRRGRDRHHSPYARHSSQRRDRDRSPRRRSPPHRSPRRASRSPRRTDSPPGRRDSRSPPPRRNSRSPPPKRRAGSRDRSPPIRRRGRSITPDGGASGGAWRGRDRSPGLHGNGAGHSDIHPTGPPGAGNGNDVNGDDPNQPRLRSAPNMTPTRNELAGEAH